MKKSISNLGNALNKAEQKLINGGNTQAQVACRVCNPTIHWDHCDMQLACDLQEASVLFE